MRSKETTPSLDDALAALSADAINGEHPPIDEILADQQGTLGDDARERLHAHLAWCDECAQLVLDLRAWPDLDVRDPEMARTDGEEAADWQAIRERLAKEGVSDQPAKEPGNDVRSNDVRSPRRFRVRMASLAAVLLAAVLSWTLFDVGRNADRPAAPGANIFVVDLRPAPETPSGSPSTTRAAAEFVGIPAGMSAVVFLLVDEKQEPFDAHVAELFRDGERFWESEKLVRLPEGGFSVSVPTAILRSGVLEIRLEGVRDGEREIAAVYTARIETVP